MANRASPVRIVRWGANRLVDVGSTIIARRRGHRCRAFGGAARRRSTRGRSHRAVQARRYDRRRVRSSGLRARPRARGRVSTARMRAQKRCSAVSAFNSTATPPQLGRFRACYNAVPRNCFSSLAMSHACRSASQSVRLRSSTCASPRVSRRATITSPRDPPAACRVLHRDTHACPEPVEERDEPPAVRAGHVEHRRLAVGHAHSHFVPRSSALSRRAPSGSVRHDGDRYRAACRGCVGSTYSGTASTSSASVERVLGTGTAIR